MYIYIYIWGVMPGGELIRPALTAHSLARSLAYTWLISNWVHS